MKVFDKLLINSLVAGVTNSFLWFAVTFWAYLETRSVLAPPSSAVRSCFYRPSWASTSGHSSIVGRRKRRCSSPPWCRSSPTFSRRSCTSLPRNASSSF